MTTVARMMRTGASPAPSAADALSLAEAALEAKSPTSQNGGRPLKRTLEGLSRRREEWTRAWIL